MASTVSQACPVANVTSGHLGIGPTDSIGAEATAGEVTPVTAFPCHPRSGCVLAARPDVSGGR